MRLLFSDVWFRSCHPLDALSACPNRSTSGVACPRAIRRSRAVKHPRRCMHSLLLIAQRNPPSRIKSHAPRWRTVPDPSSCQLKRNLRTHTKRELPTTAIPHRVPGETVRTPRGLGRYPLFSEKEELVRGAAFVAARIPPFHPARVLACFRHPPLSPRTETQDPTLKTQRNAGGNQQTLLPANRSAADGHPQTTGAARPRRCSHRQRRRGSTGVSTVDDEIHLYLSSGAAKITTRENYYTGAIPGSSCPQHPSASLKIR